MCDVSYLAVDETRDTRHETRATRYKRDIRQETCLVFRVSSVISRLSQEAGRTHVLPPQCFVYRLPGSCRGRFFRKFLGERPGKRAPGSHASEIIVRPQHREQRPNSIQLAAWLCVCVGLAGCHFCVVYDLSSVACQLSPVVCPLSSIVSGLFSVVCGLWSVVCGLRCALFF